MIPPVKVLVHVRDGWKKSAFATMEKNGASYTLTSKWTPKGIDIRCEKSDTPGFVKFSEIPKSSLGDWELS